MQHSFWSKSELHRWNIPSCRITFRYRIDAIEPNSILTVYNVVMGKPPQICSPSREIEGCAAIDMPRSGFRVIYLLYSTVFVFVAMLIVLVSPVFALAQDDSNATTSTEVSPDFKAYDFTLKSIDGKTKVNLGGLIDKNYVVVVFWAANCPICDFAMPYIALYNDFLAERSIKDVQITTVALDARVGDPLKKAINEQWTFEIVHDPMGRDTKSAYKLNEKGIPACYVFNKRGYIISTIYGFDKKFTQNVQDAINADRQSQGGHGSLPNVIIEN